MTAKAVYPKINVPFSLKLDANTLVSPLGMVCGNSKGWCHGPNEEWQARGEIITNPCEIQAVLLFVSDCQDINEIIEKIGGSDKVLSGQVRTAFMAQFQTDRKGSVGIPDASWVDQYSTARFPYVDSVGDARFGCPGRHFIGHWRWIVLSK